MTHKITKIGLHLIFIFYPLALTLWLVNHEVRVTIEDGYYYLKMAQHMAHGLGSTFDGLDLTNGYHPLWLLILVPLFWLPLELEQTLIAAILLQAIFTGGAMLCFYATVRLRCGPWTASLAALSWFFVMQRMALGGLEYSLHTLCFMATAYIYLRYFQKTPPQSRHYLGLGLLLSLTFLARLDTLLLVCILVIWVGSQAIIALQQNNQKEGDQQIAYTKSTSVIRNLLLLGLPIVLSVCLYIGLNMVFFEHPLPVSGVIKQDWSQHRLVQSSHYQNYGWIVAKAYNLLSSLRHRWPHHPSFWSLLYLGAFGGIGLWLVGYLTQFWRLTNWVRCSIQPWLPFAVYSLLSFLSYNILYHSPFSHTPWYYVVQIWLAILLLVSLLDVALQHGQGASYRDHLVSLTRWLPRWMNTLSNLSLALLCGGIFWGTLWSLGQWRIADQTGLQPQPLHDGAIWVKANLSEDVVIGSWNAGTLGYLSERQVINLDGLVNSWDYYEQERHDLCRYWQRIGLTHIVDIFDHRTQPPQPVAPIPTYPAYAACADQLDLIWRKEDVPEGQRWYLEVYRFTIRNES